MNNGNLFLLFSLDEHCYAMDVIAVDRIVPAAEMMPLPDADAGILGLINVAGCIMQVLDMRQRLGLPLREMELADRFILTHVEGRPLALLVDATEGVVELPEPAPATPEEGRSGSGVLVSSLGGRIVLIPDLKALAAPAAGQPGKPHA